MMRSYEEGCIAIKGLWEGANFAELCVINATGLTEKGGYCVENMKEVMRKKGQTAGHNEKGLGNTQVIKGLYSVKRSDDIFIKGVTFGS